MIIFFAERKQKKYKVIETVYYRLKLYAIQYGTIDIQTPIFISVNCGLSSYGFWAYGTAVKDRELSSNDILLKVGDEIYTNIDRSTPVNLSGEVDIKLTLGLKYVNKVLKYLSILS